MATDSTVSSQSPWVKAAPYLVLILIGLVVPFIFKTRFWLNIFIIVLARIIVAVGLRTITLSGELSFAQAAFMGIGGYTAGMLAKWFGMPPYLTIPAGAITATIIGVLTGLPFVRLRSMYYTMASMFLGIGIVYLFIAGGKSTGGANGLQQIPSIFNFNSMKINYYFFLALTIASCAVMYRFEFSRIGYTLRALSQSNTVAASIGINPVFYRLLAVGIGCFFAGLSGAAYALYNTVLSPNDYGMMMALWFAIYIMIGGQDRFIGPIIGTIVLVIIPEYFRIWNVYAPFATAIALLLVAYFLPGGLASIPEAIGKALNRVRSGSRDCQKLTDNLNTGGGKSAP